jgi:1,4-dihydroxy-2-naphthoyl-CoA synthase
VQTVVTGKPHDPLDDLRPLPLPAWDQRGSFQDIRYGVAEGIAKLTICRPERRNAFRPQTLFELTDAFTMARDDPDVGTIILCGEGPDAFCSGGDQKSAVTTATSVTTRSPSAASDASTSSISRS